MSQIFVRDSGVNRRLSWRLEQLNKETHAMRRVVYQGEPMAAAKAPRKFEPLRLLMKGHTHSQVDQAFCDKEDNFTSKI